MLSILPANLSDVGVLKTLIHEMGEYERLPVVITEESLARDGFGPRPEFRVLIAEWMVNQPGTLSSSIVIPRSGGVGYSSKIFLFVLNFGGKELVTLCFRVSQPSLEIAPRVVD